MNKNNLLLLPLLLVSLILSGCGPSATPAASPTASVPTAAPATLPAATASLAPTDTLLPTPTATPLPSPTPAAGEIRVSDTDNMEMVYVPAGDFSMGSPTGAADAQPVHTVTLGAFWIDRREVTNAEYTLCLQAGVCLRPFTNGSNTHIDYFANPIYKNYPVIDLRWSSADKYCTWAGRRLPTEAEWEKAARGTDGRTYPWGNGEPTAKLLNFNNPVGDTLAVGSYLKGASPYGALDMAGNVMEWVADWYGSVYYASSPQANPTGPADGTYKVLRGGSWHSDVYAVMSAARHYQAPDTRNIVVGFRCALSAQ